MQLNKLLARILSLFDSNVEAEDLPFTDGLESALEFFEGMGTAIKTGNFNIFAVPGESFKKLVTAFEDYEVSLIEGVALPAKVPVMDGEATYFYKEYFSAGHKTYTPEHAKQILIRRIRSLISVFKRMDENDQYYQYNKNRVEILCTIGMRVLEVISYGK